MRKTISIQTPIQSGRPTSSVGRSGGGDNDTLYEVEISNVSMQSGETRSFPYPVFIELDDLEELTRTNREEERFRKF